MKNKEAEKIYLKLMDEFARIRKEKGMSHDNLAKLTGLNRSTISLLESKKRIPTILTCLKICDALDISISKILSSISSSH